MKILSWLISFSLLLGFVMPNEPYAPKEEEWAVVDHMGNEPYAPKEEEWAVVDHLAEKEEKSQEIDVQDFWADDWDFFGTSDEEEQEDDEENKYKSKDRKKIKRTYWNGLPLESEPSEAEHISLQAYENEALLFVTAYKRRKEGLQKLEPRLPAPGLRLLTVEP
uniref:Uncharacterized protein n=1 Tax=Steinernema glaseri TaxID=37863 RepID=A0A1I8AHJ9_9BILA